MSAATAERERERTDDRRRAVQEALLQVKRLLRTAAGTISATTLAVSGAATIGGTLNVTGHATMSTFSGAMTSGSVPASLVTAGTFGAGAYVITGTTSEPLRLTRTGSGSNVTLRMVNADGELFFGMNANEHFAVAATNALTSSPWLTVSSTTVTIPSAATIGGTLAIGSVGSMARTFSAVGSFVLAEADVSANSYYNASGDNAVVASTGSGTSALAVFGAHTTFNNSVLEVGAVRGSSSSYWLQRWWNGNGTTSAFATAIASLRGDGLFSLTGNIALTTATDIDIITWSGTASVGRLRKITDQGGVALGVDSSLVLMAGDSIATWVAAAGITAATISEDVFVVADGRVILAPGQQSGFTSGTYWIFNATGQATPTYAGAAATPTYSFTAESDLGMYRSAAGTLAFVDASTSMLTLTTAQATMPQALSVGVVITTPTVRRNIDTATLALSGGSAATTGGNVVLYGSTHATQASDIEFRQGSTVVGAYDHSALAWLWEVPTTITSTTANQLAVRYNGSGVHMTVDVASTGVTTFDASGASAAFVFSDAVTMPSLALTTAGITVTTDNSFNLGTEADRFASIHAGTRLLVGDFDGRSSIYDSRFTNLSIGTLTRDAGINPSNVIVFGVGGANLQSRIEGVRHGGTIISPTVTVAGTMFTIYATGYTGSSLSIGGSMSFISTDTWSGTAKGTRFDIITAQDATTTTGTTLSAQYGYGVGVHGSLTIFSGSAVVSAAQTSAIVTLAGTTTLSSLRIPHGAAPSAPVNGDVWGVSGESLYYHNNGTTQYASWTRQAAIADAVGGDEMTKINAILAALRATNQIAT